MQQGGVPERADPNFVERIGSTVLDRIIINHAREAERGGNKNPLSRSTAYCSDPDAFHRMRVRSRGNASRFH